MLSNCKLKFDIPILADFWYYFNGKSMCDFSNLENAKQSISPNDDRGGTTVYCDKTSCIEKVLKDIETEDSFFVVEPYFDGPFVAKIKVVGVNTILFSFLNPDKDLFPDQSLKIDEIKSIHVVTGWCYDYEKGACDEK